MASLLTADGHAVNRARSQAWRFSVFHRIFTWNREQEFRVVDQGVFNTTVFEADGRDLRGYGTKRAVRGWPNGNPMFPVR
jgi:hypothetical protein